MATSSLIAALHSSGPIRLRVRLQTAGAKLHRVLDSASRVRPTATTLPVAVFGGDLLASLGRHLAGALTPDAASSSRPSRTQGDWNASSRSGRDRVPHRPVDDSRPMSARDRSRGPASTPDVSRFGLLEPSGSGTDARVERPMTAVTRPLTTLARQLRDADASGRSTQRLVAGQPLASPSPSMDASRADPGTARHTAPALPMAAGLETLHRFAGGASAEPSPPANPPWPASPAPAPSATSGQLRHDAETVTTTSLWDLSDRMADVLRAQARQHGIDLT